MDIVEEDFCFPIHQRKKKQHSEAELFVFMAEVYVWTQLRSLGNVVQSKLMKSLAMQ